MRFLQRSAGHRFAMWSLPTMGSLLSAAARELEHVTVAREPGKFLGWPANHGPMHEDEIRGRGWFQVSLDWAGSVAARFNYNVRFLPVGPEDSAVGSPTQMAVFESKS